MGGIMSGDQFAPIEKPYYKQWQKRLESKPVKVAKPKKRKRGRRAKR